MLGAGVGLEPLIYRVNLCKVRFVVVKLRAAVTMVKGVVTLAANACNFVIYFLLASSHSVNEKYRVKEDIPSFYYELLSCLSRLQACADDALSLIKLSPHSGSQSQMKQDHVDVDKFRREVIHR